MKIFHLPGAFLHHPLYVKLFEEIQNNPNILKENTKIGSIYGSPAGIWNGGRVMLNYWTEEDLIAAKDRMNEFNIPVRFTFSNCLLEEKHLDDTYCNFLLETFNTGNNEIICNSSILEDYIRNKYGNSYRYISSTTKRIQDKSLQLKEIDKDYYLTVIDYDYNQDFEFLKSIPNKEKSEILCNPVCKSNCPRRSEHYTFLSKLQLCNCNNETFDCPDMANKFWEVKKMNNFISLEDIDNIYVPMGFINFKLEGRTHHPLDVIEIILYYLIKEEYKDEMRGKLHSLLVW